MGTSVAFHLELERIETADEAVDRVDDAALVDQYVVDLHRARAQPRGASGT